MKVILTIELEMQEAKFFLDLNQANGEAAQMVAEKALREAFARVPGVKLTVTQEEIVLL